MASLLHADGRVHAGLRRVGGGISRSVTIPSPVVAEGILSRLGDGSRTPGWQVV